MGFHAIDCSLVTGHEIFGSADVKSHTQANEAGQVNIVVEYDTGTNAKAKIDCVAIIVRFRGQNRSSGCHTIAVL